MGYKIFDTSKILRLFSESPDAQRRVLQTVLDASKQNMNGLIDLYQERNFTALGKKTHELKSTYVHVGNDELIKTIRSINESIHEKQNLQDLSEMLVKLEALSQDLTIEIEDYLTNLST